MPHRSTVLGEADASYPRELREVRQQCRRLFSANQELKAAADESRSEACVSRRRAEAACKELETGKKARQQLLKHRDRLEAAAAADKKLIARLEVKLSEGAPSARLLDRARHFKRTAEDLQRKVDTQADALNARAAELESSRREARALAVSLNLRAEEVSATIDAPIAPGPLLELGIAKVTQHELALELAHVSGELESEVSSKQRVQEQLLLEAGKVKRCEAEISTLKEAVRLAKADADGRGEQASKAHTATRVAFETIEALLAREKGLLEDLGIARSRCTNAMRDVEMLSGLAKQGEALGVRVEELKAEIQTCRNSLERELEWRSKAEAEQRAAAQASALDQQRLGLLEDATRDKLRLDGLLQEERARSSVLLGETRNAREELQQVIRDKEELLRGLRQAKVYNDDLAKDRDDAVAREKESTARLADMKDGKMALQRALLEQLTATRRALRDERERRQQAEEALSRHLASASSASIGPVDSDEDVPVSLETLPSPQCRRRNTPVQDYLGREGAEQFLSDWDDERSSRSSSLGSQRSSPNVGGVYDDDGEAIGVHSVQTCPLPRPRLPRDDPRSTAEIPTQENPAKTARSESIANSPALVKVGVSGRREGLTGRRGNASVGLTTKQVVAAGTMEAVVQNAGSLPADASAGNDALVPLSTVVRSSVSSRDRGQYMHHDEQHQDEQRQNEPSERRRRLGSVSGGKGVGSMERSYTPPRHRLPPGRRCSGVRVVDRSSSRHHSPLPTPPPSSFLEKSTFMLLPLAARSDRKRRTAVDHCSSVGDDGVAAVKPEQSEQHVDLAKAIAAEGETSGEALLRSTYTSDGTLDGSLLGARSDRGNGGNSRSGGGVEVGIIGEVAGLDGGPVVLSPPTLPEKHGTRTGRPPPPSLLDLADRHIDEI